MRLGLGMGFVKTSPNVAGGDGSLEDVLASTVFDLDATQAASYPGSGTTWANLVTAPADGSAQTAYDFYTGDGSTSTTYPTFNGSAGSAAAYWSFDGGDNFRLKSGSNTTFLANLPKTGGGNDFWAAFAITVKTGGAQQNFFSVHNVLTNAGINIHSTASSLFRSQQRGSVSVSALSGTTIVDGSTYLFIVSHSADSNTTRFWVNSGTAVEIAHTYSTQSSAASSPAGIGASYDGSFAVFSGTRMYSFAMGNEYLDNTKAAAIIAVLEARHARDYTP